MASVALFHTLGSTEAEAPDGNLGAVHLVGGTPHLVATRCRGISADMQRGKLQFACLSLRCRLPFRSTPIGRRASGC